MRKTFWISLFVAAGGLSASSQTAPAINACVNNLNGVPRLVVSSANCINGVETFKQWNVTGAQGPQGATGPAGAQGPQGPTGSPGQRGAVGAPGPMGHTGPQGPTGNTGAQGLAGPQGTAGPTGNTGPQGPQGDTGARGPSGPTGPAGTIGPQVWSAVTTMPAIVEQSDYFFSPWGQSVPSNFALPIGVALQVPFSCTARNFNVNAFGGTGGSSIYLTTASNLTTSRFSQGLICFVGSSNNGVTSCSASGSEALTAGDFLAIGLTQQPGNNLSGAIFSVSFTCQ